MSIEQGFYSKEEIVQSTDITIHTLNFWLKSHKPSKSDIKTKGNRNYYSQEYLYKLFDTVNREGLKKLLAHTKTTPDNSQDTPQSNSQDSELVSELRNQIGFLQEQIKFLQNQLTEKNESQKTLQQLISQQQTLSKQQNDLLLESQEIKDKQEEMAKPKKLFGIF